MSASKIAKWDGTSWSALGAGLGPSAYALEVFDDGTEPAFYAGGSFTSAGGMAALRCARWDGSAWSPVGQGTSDEVLTRSVFDDGAGPALLVGGAFATAFDSGDSFLARWDGCVHLGFDVEGGAAVFDSTPGGPNDPGPDLDLLVGRGNLLVLQSDQNATQTLAGVFDQPDDDADGGTLRFFFRDPVRLCSVDLVDLDDTDLVDTTLCASLPLLPSPPPGGLSCPASRLALVHGFREDRHECPTRVLDTLPVAHPFRHLTGERAGRFGLQQPDASR